MINKCTLLVDGNWYIRSRVYRFEDKFKKDKPDSVKQQAQEDLLDMMARGLRRMLYMFPVIDNIVLVGDGGSWRKSIQHPIFLKEAEYKGNRHPDSDTDWMAIYESLNKLKNNFRTQLNGTFSQSPGIEGDDWIYYWSNKLNSIGINCIIWSSDADLKQLVNIKNNAFTAWYNDRSGLVLSDKCEVVNDPLQFFTQPPFSNAVLEQLRSKCPSISYINPQDIICSKILEGDAGDNILSIARFQKNGRTYKFSDKDYKTIKDKLNLDLSIIQLSPEIIYNYISTSKKFKPYNLKKENILEHLLYNTRMVWLDKSQYPNDIYERMTQENYNVIDVSSIKQSHNILLQANYNDIDNIFNTVQ